MLLHLTPRQCVCLRVCVCVCVSVFCLSVTKVNTSNPTQSKHRSGLSHSQLFCSVAPPKQAAQTQSKPPPPKQEAPKKEAEVVPEKPAQTPQKFAGEFRGKSSSMRPRPLCTGHTSLNL